LLTDFTLSACVSAGIERLARPTAKLWAGAASQLLKTAFGLNNSTSQCKSAEDMQSEVRSPAAYMLHQVPISPCYTSVHLLGRSAPEMVQVLICHFTWQTVTSHNNHFSTAELLQ